MKTQFYIVRHGKTLFNILHRFQGYSDSPLISEGISMAKKLHDGLIDIPFSLAASSTSERAIDTLNYIIESRNIPVIHKKNLKELYFGTREGSIVDFSMPSNELDEIGYKYCGGENREEAGERFRKCLKEIAVDGNVLVVAHAAVIFALLCYIDKSIPYEQSDKLVPNCSVTVIEYNDDEFKIIELPTTRFLGD